MNPFRIARPLREGDLGEDPRSPAASERESGPHDSTRGRRRADPRLTAYLVSGFGAMLAAIVTGQPGLAALGAPFIALAATGLVARPAATLTGTIAIEADRVVEGDEIEGVVTIEWDGEAELEVLLTGSPALRPLEPTPALGWSPSGRGPAVLPFRVRADVWGAHDLGALWARLQRPGGLGLYEQKLAVAPPLQVLPAPLRLGRLLEPAEPRAVAGMHLSRFRGHGTDFAELRPYQPGDRLRDLSWATSARLGEPWVTVRHSERTGTVLLLLDSVFGDERRSMEALARSARAAWAVASAHLRAQDRVGLLALGRATAWLPPQGGRRARWLLLEELLAVGRVTEDHPSRLRRSRRSAVPYDALIVAVTGLQSQGFTHTLHHYRRAGHAVVALVIDATDLLPEPDDLVDEAAHRLWLAQRETARNALERAGIPTALVTSGEGVGPAISALRRRTSAARPGFRRTAAR